MPQDVSPTPLRPPAAQSGRSVARKEAAPGGSLGPTPGTEAINDAGRHRLPGLLTARHTVFALGLLVLPWLLLAGGEHWVRTADLCLLYVMMALGVNIIVGEAGLLDLGYVAFYALGAYLFAWLNSAHLSDQFAWVAAHFPQGLRTPAWVYLPAAAALAALAGVLLGAPTVALRGDYLAMVTLGFGEIVRLFIVNGGHPVNLTDGAKGIAGIGPLELAGVDLSQPWWLGPLQVPALVLHYHLFLGCVLLTLLVCARLQDSRIGRAWRALRDDEMAASAMGISRRRLKLLAFAVGASFGGVTGCLFGGFQRFVSPEAFTLQESVVIVAMVIFGGIGHLPGVVLGAVLLSGLPEALRYVAGPLQALTDGRIDAGVLRPLLVALAMVGMMLWRPQGIWPGRAQSGSGPVQGNCPLLP